MKGSKYTFPNITVSAPDIQKYRYELNYSHQDVNNQGWTCVLLPSL